MMEYKEFMQKVNEELNYISGLGVYDLSDYMYRCAYDSGESPKEVALLALENSGFPLGDFS